MYLRIMNQLDLVFMKNAILREISDSDIAEKVFQSVKKTIEILDDSYGIARKPFEMGGFLFLLTELDNNAYYREEILKCYRLSENDVEYSDIIATVEKKVEWISEMYLRSSDDAIVIVYSRKAR